jgi:hypothetical protein
MAGCLPLATLGVKVLVAGHGWRSRHRQALRDLADAPAGSILVAEFIGDEWSVRVTKPEMFNGRRMVRLA